MKNLTYEKLQKLLVGKWLRNDGEIERITTRHSLNAIYTSYPFADTPQELIQVGDMVVMGGTHSMGKWLAHVLKVEVENGYTYITYYDKISKRNEKYQLNKWQWVTEIWTRTDNDTYKCQWRK